MTEKIRPAGYIVDWPDEPDLGAYFSEEPNDSARSRALYTEDDVRELLRRERALIVARIKDRAVGGAFLVEDLHDILRVLPDTEME
ncbi:hypothetical protein ACDA63_07415 [Uliginosibacterium sp. sgz301328]|uniref:hypothetical protein n=1 Tax=Uliginosibacterium sp. sgz301328 TaxID=3243764 RepID=UPI00359D90D3